MGLFQQYGLVYQILRWAQNDNPLVSVGTGSLALEGNPRDAGAGVTHTRNSRPHVLLAQASACAYPDGKRPLPAGRLTRFEERHNAKNRHRWKKGTCKEMGGHYKFTQRLEEALA
jgi:hypothetical protein